MIFGTGPATATVPDWLSKITTKIKPVATATVATEKTAPPPPPPTDRITQPIRPETVLPPQPPPPPPSPGASSGGGLTLNTFSENRTAWLIGAGVLAAAGVGYAIWRRRR